MQTEQPWYIGFRAKALSAVYLTRRDDLIVSEQPDNGLDLLVTILKNNNLTGRIFGANVQATTSSSDIVQDKNVFHIKFNADQIKYFQEFPFPVCLIFFSLDNETGYYKWILEPVIEQNGLKTLKFNRRNEFKRLTEQERDNIVSLVSNWYDTHSQKQQNNSIATNTRINELESSTNPEIDRIVSGLNAAISKYSYNPSKRTRKHSRKSHPRTIPSPKYDVLNISGHSLEAKEIESVLDSHPAVTEAVVVGKPDDLKGEEIVAFVILKENYQPSEDLKKELKQNIVKEIGDFACPAEIRFVKSLLKNSSGKIMRHLLRRSLTISQKLSSNTSV